MIIIENIVIIVLIFQIRVFRITFKVSWPRNYLNTVDTMINMGKLVF